MAISTQSNNSGTVYQTLDPLMKLYYINRSYDQLQQLMYKGSVLNLFQRLPASETIEGKQFVIPVEYGGSPNQSKDFSIAQGLAKKRTFSSGRFQIPFDDDFALERVSEKVMRGTKTIQGAFYKAVKVANKAIVGLKNKREIALFAEEDNAAAKVGTVDRTVAAKPVITLSDSAQASSFEKDQDVQFATSNTAAVFAGGPWRVDSVNRSAGTITLDKALPAGVGSTYYIFRNGDHNKTALTSLRKYIDGTATPGTLHGLDRNQDPIRLGGHYKEMDASDTFSGIVRFMTSSIFNLCQAAPQTLICNPLVEALMATEMAKDGNAGGLGNTRNDISDGGIMGTTRFGVGKLQFNTTYGPVSIHTSPFCPISEFYILDLNCFGLYYLGGEGDDFVDFSYSDSGSLFRTIDDDPGREVRVMSFGNLGCTGPGMNARVKLDSARITAARTG